MTNFILPIVAGLFCLAACKPAAQQDRIQATQISWHPNEAWEAYWYSGKAEINTYEVKQARYGQMHPGEAVAIFVTEDFLTSKQVKNESSNRDGSTSVLKTNLIKDFTTGIYDYSIMTSVFTPVNVEAYPHTLKVSMSAQDWCGQSFMQINHETGSYRVSQYSYFEKEGDDIFTASDLITEDELFNRIRLDPAMLPTGNYQLLPSLAFTRLQHIPYRGYAVVGKLTDYNGTEISGSNLSSYIVSCTELDRRLEVIFEADFPYQIKGWTDQHPSVSGGEALTTIARLKSTQQYPYWNMHSPADTSLREDLGI